MKKLAYVMALAAACAETDDNGTMDGSLPPWEAGASPGTGAGSCCDAQLAPNGIGPDAGVAADASVRDGGVVDAAMRDAAVLDAALADASVDGGARDAGPSPSACKAGPGPAGSRVIQVNGRSVTIYVPPSLGASTPVPVLFSLHGFGIDSTAMPALTDIPKLADAQGLIGVFPGGELGSWNTGSATCGLGSLISSGADDAKFIEDILAALASQYCIDRSRVFVSGFSMGGYSANFLACTRPDLFRAAAAHSSGSPTVKCADAKIPVLVLHGTNDGTISYDCGTGAEELWVEHDACSTNPADIQTETVKGGTCVYHRKCGDGSQVGLCTFQGMGHGWAGSADLLSGGGTAYESATTLMWKFFAQFR